MLLKVLHLVDSISDVLLYVKHKFLPFLRAEMADVFA
jgi:hypothetical protein